MKYTILTGDNRQTLKTLADNSIDAIVTDPPYGIDFLGKAWDANTGALETYQECLRVLKPGGHIVAFSAARTYHHLAITLEQAGFEIRDQIMWIYSSGFPKSQDVGKSIDRQSGKAAHQAELAEIKAILKQLYKDSGKTNTQIDRECGFNAAGYLKTDFKDKGWANNLPKDEKWLKLKSVLGCNDDYDDYFITTPQIKVGEKETGCFGPGSDYTIGGRGHTVDVTASQTEAGKQWSGWGTALKPAHEPVCLARKPSKLSIAKNVQKWGTGALNIDATRVPYENEEDKNFIVNTSKTFEKTGTKWTTTFDTKDEKPDSFEVNAQGRFPSNVIGEITEPYQKYFYCPKVSRRERHVGFEDTKGMFEIARDEGYTTQWDDKVKGHIVLDTDGNKVPDSLLNSLVEKKSGGNNHPTVKPVELMKYLIKLVTPPGGIVLDPFNGSGSTGMAAVELGHEYIGCELDPNYVEIAKKRIEAWNRQDTNYEELFE